MLGAVKVRAYAGNNNELGTACGKMFRTSVLTILDEGESQPADPRLSSPLPSTSQQLLGPKRFVIT